MNTDGEARRPEDLERLLIVRQHQGDVDGMVALYEPGAVLDYGGDELAVGVGAIRRAFEQLMEEGRKFDHGQVRSPVVSDDLALTSTVLPDGDITAEVARRQDDGTWRWAIDRFSIL